MDRKVAAIVTWGSVALVLAILTSFAAPHFSGNPRRAQPPVPPAAGSCGELRDGALSLLDCSQPHTVEVVHAVAATGPALTYGSCVDMVEDYVGSPASGDDEAYPAGIWSLPLRYSARLAAGPGTVGLPGWSWRACVVSPVGPAPWQGYQGSVRDVQVDTRPPALRPCFTTNDDALAVVPCSQPHSGEIVGIQLVGTTGSDTSGTDGAAIAHRRAESCRQEAAHFAGVDDPTYANTLRVLVLPGPGAPLRSPLSADTGAYYSSRDDRDWVLCTLQAGPGVELTASLADWGERALPLR